MPTSMGGQSGQARNFAHVVPSPTVGRWTKQTPPLRAVVYTPSPYLYKHVPPL